MSTYRPAKFSRRQTRSCRKNRLTKNKPKTANRYYRLLAADCNFQACFSTPFSSVAFLKNLSLGVPCGQLREKGFSGSLRRPRVRTLTAFQKKHAYEVSQACFLKLTPPRPAGGESKGGRLRTRLCLFVVNFKRRHRCFAEEEKTLA